MRKRDFIAVLVASSILLLGASVWDTQKTQDMATRGVIVYDQLSDVPSDVGFEAEVRVIFKDGINVEYLSGEEVSVGTLRHCPGSSTLAVFRVHSGVFDNETWLFTGEGYSESGHIMDQLKGLVHIARCSSTSELVFAVGPEFIREYWGELDGTVVLLMGCESMDDTGLADEMVRLGASLVVGWRGPVSIDESDEATLMLLEALVSGSPVEEAVEMVNAELGLGDRLVFYPPEAQGFRLPD